MLFSNLYVLGTPSQPSEVCNIIPITLGTADRSLTVSPGAGTPTQSCLFPEPRLFGFDYEHPISSTMKALKSKYDLKSGEYFMVKPFFVLSVDLLRNVLLGSTLNLVKRT